MAAVSLEKVSKRYGDGALVVKDFDLEIEDGEFIVIVGPSGCGKTTVLRMIAGLEPITSGQLRIGGRVVNSVPAKDRNIAMIFQDYALYPQMSVRQNIGFPLRVRKIPRREIRAKVEHVAAMLGLTDMLDSKPGVLSGGQRQRVAMGRALVREPSVFLMDEPLSNLDAKLRVKMRSEILRIHRELDVATIYVTHDQAEAMTMGDRVVAMDEGIIQQCGPPESLFGSPCNIFVAGFLGSPPMNLILARVDDDAQRVWIHDQFLFARQFDLGDYRGREVVIGIRPEELDLVPSGSEAPLGDVLIGEVEFVEPLGTDRLVQFRMPGTPFAGDARTDVAEGDLGTLGGDGIEMVARIQARTSSLTGHRCAFRADLEWLQCFDPESGKTISANQSVDSQQAVGLTRIDTE
jgi:multiple sugar transport system ATP-binding protein